MNTPEILAGFSRLKALVIGDICLDRWCTYDPATSEPSRETGIPRLGIVSTQVTPGGGGTVANNLAALGAGQVAVIGVCGDDGFGFELEQALDKGEKIEGVITGKVKGGLTVMAKGIRAFLPGSLVDLRPVKDTTPYEGKQMEFKVIKLDRKRNNVVVSRRAVLEETVGAEREQLLSTLQEGAAELVSRLLPEQRADDWYDGLLAGQRYLLSLGITGWQDAIVGSHPGLPDPIDGYLRAAGNGALLANVVGALDVGGRAFESAHGGVAGARLPFRPALLNYGGPDVPVHGGAIASLADVAACAAVWSLPETERSATVSITLNYTAPAIRTALVARATVRRRGKRVASLAVEIRDEGGSLVADALVIYKIA